jgi:DNA-binding NtrC family response regulator
MTEAYQILVVEDEARWREDIFREALEEAGFLVQTSSTYTEAVAALERDDFDLVVIDVNLTGVSGNQDGVRLLEYLAAQDMQAETIVVSGSKTRDLAQEQVAMFRPRAFVDKMTFDIAQFIELVTETLH